MKKVIKRKKEKRFLRKKQENNEKAIDDKIKWASITKRREEKGKRKKGWKEQNIGKKKRRVNKKAD